jgi:hypothetical protein
MTGLPYSLGDACTTGFSLGQPTLVTIELAPAPNFAGTLTATARRESPPDSASIQGLFAGGVAALGTASRTLTLQPGYWTFEVRAGNPMPCLPNGFVCPGFAVGDYLGSLSS